MSEILSQDEIDALLKNLNSGDSNIENLILEETNKKVINYDFRRPSKFSKDHIRTLRVIHQNYAKLVSGVLTRYLRTLFQIEVASVEALSYIDFDRSIPKPSILAIIDMSPLTGSSVLNMPPSIVYALIDRLLGGSSGKVEKIKSFTSIELSTIEGIIVQLVRQIREAWENVILLNPKVERIETNPELAQITTSNEMIILITFEISIDGVTDFMTLCIPHMVIKSIMPKLNSKLWISEIDDKKYAHENRKHVEMKANKTKVFVEVELGTAQITFNEIINLQIGDIIPLSTKINDKLMISVEGNQKFVGTPGAHNSKHAVKITKIRDY